MYSSAWLTDEKLIEAGDLVEAWFNRILCAVNDVDFETGRFEFRDAPLPPEYICPKARITQEQFKKLVEIELISKDKDGVFFIKNWEKYQDKARVFRHGARVGESSGALNGDQEGASKKVKKDNKVKSGITEEKPMSSQAPTLVVLNEEIKQKPFHVRFVDWFKVAYQDKYHKPYADSVADYKQAFEHLKAYSKGDDIETLKKLVFVAWNTPDDGKKFPVAEVSKTVKGFCTCVNRLTLPSTLTPAQLHEQRMKQKQGHGLENVL
jgi:hypothetical protein